MPPPFIYFPSDPDGGTGTRVASWKLPEAAERDPRGLDMAPPFICFPSDDDGTATRVASWKLPEAADEDERDPRGLAMAPPFIYCPSDDATGDKALMKAAIDGNLGRLKGIVKSLTKENGDLSAIFSFNNDGVNVLHIAACTGRLEVCKYLVEELGGDGNVPGYGALALGSTAFMMSAQSGDVPTFKYFLDRGGDLMKADDNGHTVLHHAAAKGSCKVTEFILSKGVPVDLDCGRGTPLYMAATNEEHKTLKILLDHHANPNIITSGVGAPLLSAVINRSWKCMRLLIKAGVDVNCKGSMITPLAFSTMHGDYTNYIKLLLKAGADPNIPDDQGRLPIEFAALRQCKEEIEMLLCLTNPIPNAPEWSIEGLISHAKSEAKKPTEERLVERTTSFKSKADATSEFYDLKSLVNKRRILHDDDDLVHVPPPSTTTIDCVKNKHKERAKMDTIQLYVKFGDLQVPVFILPKATVGEAIFDASNRLGIRLYDYYIVHGSRCLNLDASITAQGILPGTVLVPIWRLRGGAFEGLTRTETFVFYTNRFGDELFDLCHVPGQKRPRPHPGIGVSLGDLGVQINSRLLLMVRRLFALGLSAPVFTAADIIFDHCTGCFRFPPEFPGIKTLTDSRFSSTLRCLGSVIRNTFYYSPVKLKQGRANIRVRTNGNDTDQVDAEIPEYLGYLIGDLLNVWTIVVGASMEEILNYLESHIAMKTTAERIAYKLNLSLQMVYYPGGFTAAQYFMRPAPLGWFKSMVNPLNQVRGFGAIPLSRRFSLPLFCSHTRNLISHPEVHGLTKKQAEALVMINASMHVYLVNIELLLRVPANRRIGDPHVPIAPPTFTPQAGVHVTGRRLTIVNDLTFNDVCRT